MFLLNRLLSQSNLIPEYYLHPIMFLLNLLPHYSMLQKHIHLHPIMFLLNPCTHSQVMYHSLLFTSHYVPIKSRHCYTNNSDIITFTSHYVPIKSNNEKPSRFIRYIFTSHYVPIKSTMYLDISISISYLHPIMFLLNPIPI